MYGPFTAYLRPYRRLLFLGLAALGLGQAATSLIPLVLEKAVNAIGPGTSAGDLGTVLRAIRVYILQIAGLALLVAAGRYSMRRLLGAVSHRVEYDIRTGYFAHLLKLPLSYYQQHRTGDLMARATNDLNAVRIFLTYCVRALVQAILSFVLSIALMCTIDWQLALIVLLPLPVLSLGIVRMATLIQRRFRLIQEFFGHISNFIQENLAGIRVVKAYAQGPAQIEAFGDLNQAYLEKNQNLIRTRALYYPLFSLMTAISLGLILWFGGRAVAAGTMDIGGFVAFNAYLTLLLRPVSFLGWVVDRSQRALVAMRRISDILEAQPEIEDRPGVPGPRRQLAGHVEFRHLGLAYGDVPVLQDINLDIPAGSTLGIIGRVGAGKTTLARLIPRLIQADEGQLLLDGIPVDQWPLEQLRGAFLFSDTIRANVAYGAAEAEEADVVAAAEQAQLREEVLKFELGFHTVVGERGVTLSGGQKQRATLARALIRQPRILILDDVLSAVDTQTEEAILVHLREVMKERTTIIIAHRISALRAADHIVVLDQGRLLEEGRHRDLVARGGLYAELFERQQLAAELESL